MARWVGLGLPPETFWSVTPREMVVMMDGATQRLRRDQGLIYTLAQLMTYAVNDPKNMPDFAKAFPSGAQPQRVQSPDAVIAALDAWAARQGARLN